MKKPCDSFEKKFHMRFWNFCRNILEYIIF